MMRRMDKSNTKLADRRINKLTHCGHAYESGKVGWQNGWLIIEVNDGSESKSMKSVRKLVLSFSHDLTN